MQLNAAIHHAVPAVTTRAVRDFGAKMVADCKEELIKHFTTKDLNDTADLIISKAGNLFLDKCLEKRLMTIEAKPLINALARAERLGYEPSDIVDDDKPQPAAGYHQAFTASAASQLPPPTTGPNSSGPLLQCLRCYRTFIHKSAYEHVCDPGACVAQPERLTLLSICRRRSAADWPRLPKALDTLASIAVRASPPCKALITYCHPNHFR
jgi:hypothetical protein